MIILMTIFLIGFSVGMVLFMIYMSDPFNRVGLSILCGLFAVLGAIGLYDGLKNTETIDGDYFISRRFFKTKKFQIREIARVSLMGQFVILLDSSNKTLVKISTSTGNLDKIMDRLNDFGVVVEVV
jgi:hypothetical protein